MKKYLYIYLPITLLIVIVIFFLINFSRPNKKDSIIPSQQFSPTPLFQKSSIPLSTLLIPTKSPSLGSGIDENSIAVKQSTSELEKIARFLPFTKSLTSSQGTTVDIYISAITFKESPWRLTVFVEGIDYNTPEESPSYPGVKNSFLEASDLVFAWLKGNGVDVSKIFISWGDKTYIQNRAEKWLSSKN